MVQNVNINKFYYQLNQKLFFIFKFYLYINNFTNNYYIFENINKKI